MSVLPGAARVDARDSGVREEKEGGEEEGEEERKRRSHGGREERGERRGEMSLRVEG